jgi:hypothetical protein
MGIDICGFLEVSNWDEENLADDHAWLSCLDVGSLGLSPGAVCSVLFGESRQTLSQPDALGSWAPVANRRGVPANLAWGTARGVQEASDNEASLMSTWGYTYISYEEITQIEWQAYPEAVLELAKTHGWGLLFKLMKTLDDAAKHQRLVVWFEWR